MKNFNRLSELVSMVYIASIIKEVSAGNIKEEYIYPYPSSEVETVRVTSVSVKYSHLDWSVSFSHTGDSIVVFNSYQSDFKRVRKVLNYTLKYLLEEKVLEYLKIQENV